MKNHYFTLLIKRNLFRKMKGYCYGNWYESKQEENACIESFEEEHPWFLASGMKFKGYIYKENYSVGIILLRQADAETETQEIQIFPGIKQSVDIWDNAMCEDGSTEKFYYKYTFELVLNEEYLKQFTGGEIPFTIAEAYHQSKEDDKQEKAAFWYEVAAGLGHVEAMCFLGHMYEAEGHGWEETELDCGEPSMIPDTSNAELAAEKWYRMAAEQGDPMGMYHLGRIYCQGGNDVNWPEEEGVPWLEKAYSQGVKDAAAVLGDYYMGGTRHNMAQMDYKKCIYYLQEAVRNQDKWSGEKLEKVSFENKRLDLEGEAHLAKQMRDVLTGKSLGEQQEYFKIKSVSWSIRGEKTRTYKSVYELGNYLMYENCYRDTRILMEDGCIVGIEYAASSSEKFMLYATDDDFTEVYKTVEEDENDYNYRHMLKVVFERVCVG